MINYKDLFNFDDDEQLNKAIQLIERLGLVYDKAIQDQTAMKQKYKSNIKELVKSTEQLETELKKLDPAISEDREKLAQLSKTADIASEKYDEMKGKVTALEGSIGQLTEEQKAYNAKAEETIKLKKDQAKLDEKLNSLSTDQAKEIAKTRLKIQERNKALKESAKESLGLVTLYQKESKRLVELRTQYKNIALAQGSSSKEAKALLNQVEELDTKLKDVDASAGQFGRNVGNYPDIFNNIGGAAGGAIGGIKGMGAALKGLLANPVVAILAVIAGAIMLIVKAAGFLINTWKKTSAGAEMFAKIGGLVEGVMSAITGIVNKLAPMILSLFNDPLGALKSFGQAIWDNVINRFEGAIKLGKLLGKAISQLWKGDFKGLRDTAGEAGDAIIQMATGLDSEQQKKFAKAVAETTNEIVRNAKAFAALALAQRRVRQENRELEKSAERLITQEEKLKSIRDDATKSFAEREAASEKAREILEKRTQAQLKLAQNNLDLINTELELRRKNGEEVEDLLDKQLEAYKAFIGAEREYTLAVRENEKERDMLKQDRLEKDLDILIDGFDNQKGVNERIIADDRRVLEERRKLFQETKKLSDDSFAQQIATVQKFTNEAIDANDLLATSDAVVLNEKIRQLGLSEIIEGRLLEVIRDRRTAVQDLADVERSLTEAEIDRQKRLDSVTQFELDRVVARKALAMEFGLFNERAVDDRVQAEIEAEQFRAKSLLSNEKLLAEERVQINQELEDNITAIRRQGADDRLAIAEREAATISEVVGGVGNVLAAFGERASQKAEQDLTDLEARKERELELAGNNASQREAIERRYEQQKEGIENKQRQRQKRQAIFDKALAFSQAVTFTALEVIKAGVITPKAIAIGIIGGLNAAAIAAQPIPAYKHGTSGHGGGAAIIGDGGQRELVIEPGKKPYLSDNKATLVNLPKGTQVVNGMATDQLLRDGIDSNNSAANGIRKQVTNDRAAIASEQARAAIVGDNISKGIRDGLADMAVHQWNVKNGELTQTVRKGNTIHEDWERVNSY